MKLRAYLKEESLASVLGIEKDTVREQFLSACKVLEAAGVEVEIFDALKNKEKVKDIAILPSFEVNGKIEISGQFPSNKELATFFDVDYDKFEKSSTGALMEAANDGRIGYCCGVGTDIYLDPNEEK